MNNIFNPEKFPIMSQAPDNDKFNDWYAGLTEEDKVQVEREYKQIQEVIQKVTYPLTQALIGVGHIITTFWNNLPDEMKNEIENDLNRLKK